MIEIDFSVECDNVDVAGQGLGCGDQSHGRQSEVKFEMRYALETETDDVLLSAFRIVSSSQASRPLCGESS